MEQQTDSITTSSYKNLLHLPGILHDANVAGNFYCLQRRNEICRDLTELGCDIASKKKKGPGRKWLSWHKFSKQTCKRLGMNEYAFPTLLPVLSQIQREKPWERGWHWNKETDIFSLNRSLLKIPTTGRQWANLITMDTKFHPHENDMKIYTHLSCIKGENKGNEQYFLCHVQAGVEQEFLLHNKLCWNFWLALNSWCLNI